MASDLEAALAAFVAYYNYRRYHKACRTSAIMGHIWEVENPRV